MNSILITGCNRGLGLGLVKQLLESSKSTKHIFATCRNPDKAQVTWNILWKKMCENYFPVENVLNRLNGISARQNQ